mmetsp:Transcript_14059/g.23968  ORF Transcript_14059/g.23968 Transcript_14059/m.23968 type:complete len:112 (-) Transcript_14059:1221-1556(-)
MHEQSYPPSLHSNLQKDYNCQDPCLNFPEFADDLNEEQDLPWSYVVIAACKSNSFLTESISAMAFQIRSGTMLQERLLLLIEWALSPSASFASVLMRSSKCFISIDTLLSS